MIFTSVKDPILKGLKAGSLGLIMSAAAIILSLAFFKNGKAALTSLQLSAIVIFLIVLIIERRWKVNPVTLILFSGLLGSLVYA